MQTSEAVFAIDVNSSGIMVLKIGNSAGLEQRAFG